MGDFFFFHLLFLILLHKCAFPPQLHLALHFYYGSYFPSYTCASSFICTVRGTGLQLGRLCSGKADGPDGVSVRLLKDRATQPCQPLSLQLEQVLTLWKTSRTVPVPKIKRPPELNDYRPVAFTSHIMKNLADSSPTET